MARHGCWKNWAFLALVPLLVGLAGCAGGKRFPPLDQGSDSPGGQVPSGVPRLLTVGLVEGAEELTLAVSGAAQVVVGDDPVTGARLAPGGPSLECARMGDQVVWTLGGREGRGSSVSLEGLDPAHRLIHGEFRYRGDLRVICTPGGTGLTLINIVDLEAYLYGVVPWEIGRHGMEEMAALQAQAVAARTYTISHLQARQDRGFDVYASVMDQVYRGSGGEDDLCNRAVDSTRGLILTHQGRPIAAYYSACCGGRSSHIQEVWPHDPEDYLQGRADKLAGQARPVCADYRYFDWREEWTREQLDKILARTLPAYLDYAAQEEGRTRWCGNIFTPAHEGADPRRPGQLLNLVIKDYTSSGRVARLDIRCQAGTYHVRGDRTRWVLERPQGVPTILRSASFEVELTSRDGHITQVAARGRGYGHGIGLCQAGALERARRGQDYQGILAHYYPGSRLVRHDAREGNS